MIESRRLSACPGVRHAFFGRTGGVSGGLFASLNVGFGSGDRRDRVIENRRRVAASQGVEAERLLTLHQVHGDDVVTVTRARDAAGRRADAMVTDRPDLALGVLTADCAPVLFADPAAGVVGAAHAGWGGALRGVIEATVAAMEALGASRRRIVAEVGPCIAQPSYEVGPEFHARFVAADPDNDRFFVPADRDGHRRFDLPGYALKRAKLGGVGDPAWTGHDTCALEDRFFSYRRGVLRGEPDYGRQIATIGLAPHD